MKLLDLLRMSADSLLKRKVRTILTVLGVVIGTTSIVVMISLGIGMKNSMVEEMESYGNLRAIEVTLKDRYDDGSGEDEDQQFLDDALVETLSGMEHVESVNAVLQTQAILRIGSYECYANIQGMSIEGMKTMDIPIAQGDYPSPGDELKFLYGNCMIAEFYNAKTQVYDYWENGTLPDIDLYNDPVYAIFDVESYYSAGSTDENGQVIAQPKKIMVSASGMVEGGPDDWNNYCYYAFCDIDALKAQLERTFKGRVIPGQPVQKSGKPYREIFYTTIYVNVDDMDNVTQIQQQITDMGYETYAEAEWIESQMQEMNIIQAVLGGIGAVSLLVAAIGITNTMMMSIYERTKEIGIMKVIGCRIRDIQILFLTEAGYIGFIGGSIGVAFSYGISALVNRVVGMSDLGITKISQIPLWLSGTSIIFAIIIGMVAGLLPSIRAMRLSPLAAIRSE